MQDVLDDLGGFEPSWESRYPGRLGHEIQALLSADIRPKPIPDAIQSGVLGFRFDWLLNATTTLRLEAIYPHEFPEMRPQVYLISGLDPIPDRHVSPIEGNLCLLGRDSRQWRPRWTLFDLLKMQLEPALRGGSDEDHQGEPTEYWWNALGRIGAYCLVDSSWGLGSVEEGYLRIQYTLNEHPALQEPQAAASGSYIIRAAVTEVLDHQKQIINRATGPLPREIENEAKALLIPWVRLQDDFRPQGPRAWVQQMEQLSQESTWLQRTLRAQIVTHRRRITLFAVAHPVEVEYERYAVGWTVFQVYEKLAASKRRGKGRRGKSGQRKVSILPVYRAGHHDLGYRVPAVQQLRDKCIIVVGTGAVGAPVAVELARNGCNTLHLVEHDVVEPGNTVRWPLGASSWGVPKARALKKFLESEYPWTSVHAHPWQLGQAAVTPGDGPTEKPDLDELLAKAELVIDGSAAHGVTTFLAQRCRAHQRPLISLSAVPNLKGGTVVRHTPEGGCPICLQRAWDSGDITPPAGYREDEELTQPPGCSEQTFLGASYDLQELSLQTVRLAVDTLEQGSDAGSLVQTLNLVDDEGRRSPPFWYVAELPRHPKCSC